MLERESAKGRTTKRSIAVLAVSLFTAGALISITAQRIGMNPVTEMFGLAAPNQMSKAISPAPVQRLGAIAHAKTKKQVVLVKDVEKLGKAGELKKVKPGFMRNYLFPRGMAAPVTQGILDRIEKDIKEEEARKAAIKEEAYKIQTALNTIGKFTIKKKVGEEDKIFGSVTAKDIAETIKNEMDLDLDKSKIEIPDINKLGTYDASIKLHPDGVYGLFKVVVAKDTSS